MEHHVIDYLQPFGLLAIVFTLSHYNLVIGSLTATLVCIYTAMKLINEIKNYRKNKRDSIQRKTNKDN
jgi:hypothetical protein